MKYAVILVATAATLTMALPSVLEKKQNDVCWEFGCDPSDDLCSEIGCFWGCNATTRVCNGGGNWGGKVEKKEAVEVTVIEKKSSPFQCYDITCVKELWGDEQCFEAGCGGGCSLQGKCLEPGEIEKKQTAEVGVIEKKQSQFPCYDITCLTDDECASQGCGGGCIQSKCRDPSDVLTKKQVYPPFPCYDITCLTDDECASQGCGGGCIQSKCH